MAARAILTIYNDKNKKSDFKVQYNPRSLDLAGDGELSFELIIIKQGNVDVLDTVCAFLGLSAMRASRKAEFHWGTMSFKGDISQMSAGFDKFDEGGDPVSGTVSMTIRQTGGFGEQQSYWSRAYEEISI